MTPLAASGGSFLISPNVGLMIWTLVVFGISVFILNRAVFPRIRDALDRRQKAIEESIDSQERLKADAEQVLAEYREQLAQARIQAEEIIALSREAASEHDREALIQAREQRDKMLEQTKHDIEAETRRALEAIRKEITTLTILATEKVTRRTLTAGDQKKLVEEAIRELDFTVLEGSEN
jgi:F-type H+-transporting ATPase subunit b